MHEIDLQFIKTIDDSGAGDKIHENEVIATPNLAGLTREQRDEMFARYDEGLNSLKFRRYALEAHNIAHQTLRRSHGSYVEPLTYEDEEKQANNLVPDAIKSKKEDIELEITEYEEAIGYLQESISEESRKKAESNFAGSRYYLEVRCSENRTQTVSIREWHEHEAETNNKITIESAWRDRQKTVSILYDEKLKERENTEARGAIEIEGKELASQHKRLRQKIQKILEKTEVPTYKDAKSFIEVRKAMATIEDRLHTLSLKFDSYQTSTEAKFPSLANELTSNQLHYTTWLSSKYSDKIKELERIYREGKEASKA